MKFLNVSWNQVEKMCEKIAQEMREYKPEVLVGISRGGLVPVRIISDILDIHNIVIMRVQFYRSIGKTTDEPKIIQGKDLDIRDKRVLVIDDIADTGKSLAVIQAYLRQKHPKKLKFVTLHYKKQSTFKPDFYLSETDKWVIYPWERREVKRELKALKKG